MMGDNQREEGEGQAEEGRSKRGGAEGKDGGKQNSGRMRGRRGRTIKKRRRRAERSRCARKKWMAWRSGRGGKNTRNIGREDSASTAPTRLRTARAGRSRGGALLVKWCWGLDGTEACTPVVPEHFVSHWNRQCETKRRAGKRANAKPMPADRFARLAKARHYVSSCVPRVGDVDARVDHTTLGID